MSIPSNVCTCVVCTGPECRGGCQDPATQSATACSCGDTCRCEGCRCADASQPERG